MIYAYEYHSEEFTRVNKNILMVDYMISTVDTRDLKPNVILALVEMSFSK